MAFIHWCSKHQNPPLMLGRVNRIELTPQHRSLPEGSARETVRWPARPLQADSAMAARGAEGNLAGLLTHSHPKTISSWTRSASWSSVVSWQAKAVLATCQFPCNRNGSCHSLRSQALQITASTTPTHFSI